MKKLITLFAKKNMFRMSCLIAAIAVAQLVSQSAFAQRKSAEELARIKAAMVSPSQKGIDVDTMTDQEMASATLEQDGAKGYILKNASGITIRTLYDTDGDSQLDQWGFYKDGVEVYRDIDSDKDKTADQMRWFNTGGTRWGVDTNKDGVIDYWKVISPEEVAEEIVLALASRDVNRFMRVALTAEDVKKLPCGPDMTQKLNASVGGLRTAFQQAIQSIAIPENAMWGQQFSAMRPNTIPAGTNGSTQDIIIYVDPMTVAIDNDSTIGVMLGSMVKIGDVWKVAEAPRSYGTASVGSVFAPGQTGEAGGMTSNPAIQEKINAIQELEKQLATASAAERTAIYNQIIILRLETASLFAADKDLANRDKWLRDLADFIYAAVSIDGYVEGIEKLRTMSKGLGAGNSDVAAYMQYRAIESEFFAAQTAPGTDAVKNYSDRLAKLEQLANDFPNTTTAAQVQIVLIGEYELANRVDDAKKTANAIKAAYPNTVLSEKADGYLRRIDSIGMAFPFEGVSSTGSNINLNQYNGKIVALYFWSSWADPSGDVAAEVKKIQARYEREGLSVIGVNLDESAEAMQAHVTKNATKWPNIHEPGGQESRPAVYAGVSMPPFFILIGKDGKVANNLLLQAEDLDRAVFSLTRE